MTSVPILPSLRGQLASTSIGELLALALDRKLSGSVVIETPAREKNVLVVEAGRLTKARTAAPLASLGQLLVARGALDVASLDAALLLAVQRRVRLGQALVELQLLAPEALDRSLGEQLARRLAWLGRLPLESSFAYYGQLDLLAQTPASNAEPLSLLWRAIRDAAEPHPRQRGVLESLLGRSLELAPEATPERFVLSPEEQRLVEVLRGGAVSLKALLSSCGLMEERARRLVYTLQLTHQLSIRADELARDRVSSTSRLAPPSQRAPELLPQSQRPSQLDPQRRVAHALERATRGARTQDAADAPMEAARAFQAALLCVRRKRFGEAESFARAASDAEPGNPEYLALHAWLGMHAGALSTPAKAAHIMSALNRAVLKARESVSIRFYRAQVLKRLGKDEEAFKDFRFVARREPNNLDAVREVRLHMMRARNKPKVSGVFSKLFLR